MIDLHCHLLPGIDDGPATLEESLALCRIAVAGGTTHAIVTPHIHPGRWDNTRNSIRRECAALAAVLAEHGIPLHLGFAAEVRVTDQVMQQIAADEIPFYGEVDGYRIMLLEFPHGRMIPGSEKLAAWLLHQGIRPLIAHPERNRQLMKDPGQLQPFIDMGCWLQLTAGSVTGGFGKPAQELARQLLDDEVVTVLASDGHNSGARQPTLEQTFEFVARHYGKDRAWQLMLHMPRRIVADQFNEQATAA